MARSGQVALHDTVATRMRRFVGHILRLPATRPVSLALEWTPEDGRRRLQRPRRTWQDTLKEDLWTGVRRERLPAIVPDGDNSSPDAPLGIGGTESKSVSYTHLTLPTKRIV